MIRVGDKISFVPAAFEGRTAGFAVDLGKPVTGEVIFINERRHWCRVEWPIPLGRGVNHECFYLDEAERLRA